MFKLGVLAAALLAACGSGPPKCPAGTLDGVPCTQVGQICRIGTVQYAEFLCGCDLALHCIEKGCNVRAQSDPTYCASFGAGFCDFPGCSDPTCPPTLAGGGACADPGRVFVDANSFTGTFTCGADHHLTVGPPLDHC